MITPVILAAGASSRMGSPKPLCDFDGRAALELVLDACRGLGTPVVVLGGAREEIQKRVDLARVTVAINEDPETGQTASLKAGLSHLSPSSEAFLLFPVDFPLVTIEDVGAIEAAMRKEKDAQKKIFIPSYSLQRGHPVLCRAEIAAEFLDLPDSAPARMVINHRPQRIRYVDFERPNILMDMDTPEDYQKCLAEYRADHLRRSRK